MILPGGINQLLLHDTATVSNKIRENYRQNPLIILLQKSLGYYYLYYMHITNEKLYSNLMVCMD